MKIRVKSINSSKSPKVSGFSRCVLYFIRVLGFFFLFFLSLVVGESRLGLGLALAFLAFCWLISRWIVGFPLRSWYGWAIVGLLCAFVLQFNDKSKQGNESSDDDKTSVKDEESKEERDLGGGEQSQNALNPMSMRWYDFAKRLHRIDYTTRHKAFQDSRTFRDSLRFKDMGQHPLKVMSNLYYHLIDHDVSKLDMLTEDLRRKAIKENMNALQAAEMVTTMIQEIDYVLVHDETCKEMMDRGNTFVKEYHQKKLPCLPSIFAGVQAPYEFAHNQKGDCDTRTMLAHMILTRLGISSSIWLSESYGHSVLGVAIPLGLGSSNYKEINGIKHYAVELTAKNFQIGMLIPEQQNMKNWTVTNYQNLTP